MATNPFGLFDPNLGYVPQGYYGQAPLYAYNQNYNPETGQQSPTGGVGANPYPFFRYAYSGPGMDPYGTPQDNLTRGYPFETTTAIDRMASNNRDIAGLGGLQLQNDINNYTRYQAGRAGNYEDQATSAWNPIAQGFGGYTDAQKEAILNNPYLQSLQLTPEQAQGNYLTEQEQAGITGNPWGVMDYLGGRGQGLEDTANMWAGQVGEGLGSQEASINNVLGGTSGALRGIYGQQRGDQQQNLSDIAALTRGTVGQGYGDVRGALGYGEQMGTQYIDPSKLSLSGDYLRDYNVSGRDMQNIRDRAGRQVGAQAQLDEENLLAAANAQGNTNPLALATARDRIRRTGEVNKANAMTDAEIQARALGLGVTQNRENTRLGAEQGLAGLGTSAGLTLGGRALAAEQGLLNANLNNEQYMGANTLGTYNQLGNQALGAEQYLGSQALQGQQYLGQSRLSNLQDLAQRGVQTNEYTTGLGVPAYQGAESAASSRYGSLAGNRQATNQYNQGQEYNRGQYIYGAGAAANTNFANQQRTDEQQYRDYLSNMQNQANQNTTIGQQQKIGAYGSTNQGIQGATSGAIQNYAVPSLGEKLLGKFAKGGVQQGPHMALVGEAGPELIIDLDRVPHYGDGFDPMGSGEADEPEEFGWMHGKQVKRGQDTGNNPLYEQIRKGAAVGGLNLPNPGGDMSQPSGGSNGGGLLNKGIQIASLFGLFAKGGVVAHRPHPSHPHSYETPNAELVTGPQIRMLGEAGPQAVIPLRRKPGNKVNVEDIPRLAAKYGR